MANTKDAVKDLLDFLPVRDQGNRNILQGSWEAGDRLRNISASQASNLESVDQDLGTTSDVTHNNVEIDGDLNHDGDNAGFYGTDPVAQPSSTGETGGFTAGSGTSVNDDSTFTGNVGSTAYTVGDLVKHLKNTGLLAS